MMITERISSDYVEMRFGPRWTYISCVRRFVASFFMIGLSDKERAEQISMAASELLENAVKYASEEEGYLKITIAKADHEVDVCVKNKAEAHHINTLR
ncbi:MAG: ATP-binding protein, partial [Thermoanaerobaculia bacterium]